MNMAKNKLSRIICKVRESISNSSSSSQKPPGVLVGLDGSDGTVYLLVDNFTLPFALDTYILYFASGMLLCILTIRTTSVLHSWQALQISCNRLHNT